MPNRATGILRVMRLLNCGVGILRILPVMRVLAYRAQTDPARRGQLVLLR